MRYFVILLVVLAGLGCKRALTRSEVEAQLKKAMLNKLIQRPDYDSNLVHFDIKEVTYYEEPKLYNCQFVVHMRQGHVDTTGSMAAKISKDFRL